MGKGGSYRPMTEEDWRRLYEDEKKRAEAFRVEGERLRRALRDLRDTVNATLEKER